MPQFRPKAMLERSAAADVSKNTLSRIPTLFGRLVYLSSLRDPDTGAYRHHGLASIFGREESKQALAEHHERVFFEWINLPLAEKKEDLENYLVSLTAPRAEVLGHWVAVRAYRGYIPASARESERELFFAEFDVMLDSLACSDPGADSRA